MDQAAGFTFSINWGDGTTQVVDGLTGSKVHHVYKADGTYTMKVTATDKDGGKRAAVTQAEFITPALLETDPVDSSKTARSVGGTTRPDRSRSRRPTPVTRSTSRSVGRTSVTTSPPATLWCTARRETTRSSFRRL